MKWDEDEDENRKEDEDENEDEDRKDEEDVEWETQVGTSSVPHALRLFTQSATSRLAIGEGSHSADALYPSLLKHKGREGAAEWQSRQRPILPRVPRELAAAVAQARHRLPEVGIRLGPREREERTEREIETKRDRDRDIERQRQRQRDRETERQREAERDREREKGVIHTDT